MNGYLADGERTKARPRSSTENPGTESKKAKSCDEEFLEELQRSEAYKPLNVRHVFAKMAVWCQMYGKQPTRNRLIGWLNREDSPMGANGTIADGSSYQSRVDRSVEAGKSYIAKKEAELASRRVGN